MGTTKITGGYVGRHRGSAVGGLHTASVAARDARDRGIAERVLSTRIDSGSEDAARLATALLSAEVSWSAA